MFDPFAFLKRKLDTVGTAAVADIDAEKRKLINLVKSEMYQELSLLMIGREAQLRNDKADTCAAIAQQIQNL